MGAGKSHTRLSLVNKWNVEAHYCEFWQGTVLSMGMDVLVHFHAEDISCNFVRTDAIYAECISSNYIKCINNAPCLQFGLQE